MRHKHLGEPLPYVQYAGQASFALVCRDLKTSHLETHLADGRAAVQQWVQHRWSEQEQSCEHSSDVTQDAGKALDWWCLKAAKGNGGCDVSVLNAANAAAVIPKLPAAADGTYVIQRYVTAPLLRQGRKFHFRAFGLLRADMQAWLYEGACLLCASKQYTPGQSDDPLMHLTNLSVQKGVPGHQPQVS